MNIFVNNNSEKLVDTRILSALLKQLNLIEKQGIAVAVNNEVVLKTKWNEHELKENDRITIIKATQGG